MTLILIVLNSKKLNIIVENSKGKITSVNNMNLE